MGSTYGMALILLLTLAIIFLLLGTLLFGKLKRVRNFFLVLALIFFLWGVVGVPIFHGSDNKAAAVKYQGVYHFDTQKSHLGGFDLKPFSQLSLIVEDGIFYFNYKPDFFPSTKGSWTYQDDGDLEIVEGQFDTAGGIDVHTIRADYWLFSISSKENNVDSLFFVK